MPQTNPVFILAPMDDVTDTVFRRVVHSCAPADMYFTEFVSVDGLQSVGRQKLLKRIQNTPAEGPLVVQIWGKNPDNYFKTARQIVDGTFAHELAELTGEPERQYAGFIGIDINMGCPDKNVVKNGCCSALICNRPLAEDIIAATQEGAQGKLPVSVKTRVGFNDVDMSWPEWLLGKNLHMLTIHGRTRKQMSKVPANWELIGQVRQIRDDMKLNTLIVGNGDVLDRRHGLELAERYKLDGIMIGRGIFQDPYAFAAQSPWGQVTPKQRKDLYRSHVELFAKTWLHHERPIHTLNKFCKIYINGFDGAKELREELMNASSTDELVKILTT